MSEDKTIEILKSAKFVIFEPGLSCTWDIKRDIKKHYDFG